KVYAMLFFILLSGLCTLPLTLSPFSDLFQQNCVSMKGHLASVHSIEEHTFIRELALKTISLTSLTTPYTYTWLGATDAAQEGKWVWTDGSAFDYINWSSGQPDDFNSEDCLMMNLAGMVSFNHQSASLSGFILYKPLCLAFTVFTGC
ncbi:hypothetical protein NFI96_013868, partial [Prochilodus magdalenae]